MTPSVVWAFPFKLDRSSTITIARQVRDALDIMAVGDERVFMVGQFLFRTLGHLDYCMGAKGRYNTRPFPGGKIVTRVG